MFKLIRQILGSAAIIGAAFFPQAHAGLVSTVVDFEGGSLTGLYVPGDPDFGMFTHAEYVMAPTVDFGTIDTAAALDTAVAPTGNATQFYFNSNDGGLALARQDGGKFNLDGFSAAFVPQSLAASQTIVVVAYAWFADNTKGGLYFGLGDTRTSGNFPFMTFGDPVDFSKFVDVIQVEFFACVLDTNVCGTPSRNNAQFALDDIRISTVTDDGTVPEPGTLALLSLGLLGLRLRSRRNSI